MLLEIIRGLRELAFPSICIHCHTLVPDSSHFCTTCSTALLADPHSTCPRCASNVGAFMDLSKGCPRCRDEKYQFERVFRLGEYEGTLRDVVLSMKQPTGAMLAECLGLLWAQHAEARFREVRADVVIPIPLHWSRYWKRRYNQSQALSEAIADRLKVAHCPRWLRRVLATPEQTSLSGTERRQNLRGAFRAARGADLKGKTVLLIDDVLTTGTTLNEASRALREAGAARVIVAILAHR